MKYAGGIVLDKELIAQAVHAAKTAVSQVAQERLLSNMEAAALIYEVVRVGKRQAEAAVWQHPYRP